MVAAGIALVACGSPEERRAIGGATTLRPAAPAPPRIAPGVPHGGMILLVAATEQGDAAVTSDHLGEVRLWPTLDGRRPPFVVPASAPAQVAIGHDGADLLVAILDDAHAAHLTRISREGVTRGHVTLPDLGYQQLVAIDGGVLARRADQSIELYDATGARRGRLVPDPGEQVTAIAVRRGQAIALLGTGETSALRWITLGDTLRWGARLALPAAASGDALALAPDHKRAAVADAASHDLAVYDLDTPVHRHTGSTISITARTSVGFVDPDHVAIAGTTLQWWTATGSNPDPWGSSAPVVPVADSFGEGLAVAEGLALSASGPSLAISDLAHVRYLGWGELGLGSVTAAGGPLSFSSGSNRLRWLDGNLASSRALDAQALGGANELALAIAAGEHHVIVERREGNSLRVELVDLAHPKSPVAVHTYVAIDGIEVEPITGQLQVHAAGAIDRYALDLARTTVTPLPSLVMPEATAMVRLLDPARAAGAIAVAISNTGEGQRMTVFHAPASPDGHPIAGTRPMPIRGTTLGIDVTGAVYVMSDDTPRTLAVYRDGHEVERVPLDPAASRVVVSSSGAWLAQFRGNDIVLVDHHGIERWQATVWGASGLVFTSDEHRVVVQTTGGLVALDTASGAKVASACGWEFGLHDTPPVQTSFGVPVVCEDD